MGEGNPSSLPSPPGRPAGPGRSYLASWAAPSPLRRGPELAMAARPGPGSALLIGGPAPAALTAAADTGSAGGRAHLARLLPAGGGSGPRPQRVGRGRPSGDQPAVGLGVGLGGYLGPRDQPAWGSSGTFSLSTLPLPGPGCRRGGGSAAPEEHCPGLAGGERGRVWGGELEGPHTPAHLGMSATVGHLAALRG